MTAEVTVAATVTATVAATTAMTESVVTAVELPPVNPAEVKGNINSGGSSTVGPLSIELASRFKQDGYADEIKIDIVGTGAGIDRFCRGEYDVANASRAIKDAEIEACKANGIDPISFRVGTDALTIVVSKDNTFLNGVTAEQLAKIYSGEAKTWADVDPSYPAEAIRLFSPGTDSGTYDFFT